MTKILIVDDAAVDRQLAGRLLEKQSNLVPIYAGSASEALKLIASEKPDAVLTDMLMPDMDGLELVEQVKSAHPQLPVIIMTAHGSEEIAVKALRIGAASYVPKNNLSRDLLEVIEGVLEASHAKRAHHRLMRSAEMIESTFVLENDPALIPALVGHLKEDLADMTDIDETTLLRVTIALREAVLNAMEHGNLELNSAQREAGDYYQLRDERRSIQPYKDRRVRVVARQGPEQVSYVVLDEGQGFDPSNLPDPLDPANLEKSSGRGLLLIRTFMSEVGHNPRGNVITMVRRFANAADISQSAS